MEKVQVPKMVQKQRVIPKFGEFAMHTDEHAPPLTVSCPTPEWDRRVICVPREVTEPVTKMVPRTVQV